MPNFQRRTLTWALSDSFLRGRMSFISGPRQIGKTTAVRNFLSAQGYEKLYYNWDTVTVKRRFSGNPLFFLEDLPAERQKCRMALDEIHKYPKWKNLLKGYYDEWKDRIGFIVTGSARLDHFRKSGDSLVGRYFLFRLLPLGLREVMGEKGSRKEEWLPGNAIHEIPVALPNAGEVLEDLLNLSGFPEPLAAGEASFCNRWRDNHTSLILNEDLRDLTRIHQARKLETLLYLLPERVGSPLSLNSLCRPLEAAHGSIRLWLNALKLVYLLFSIPPWTFRLSRSVLKEEKYYFWDWGMAGNHASRFENFVAVQLQRVIAGLNEQGKGSFKLHYLRTKEGREVDFVVAEGKKIHLLIEAKTDDSSLDRSLPLFQERVQADLAIQVVRQRNLCVQKGKGLYVMGADRLFSFLP